MHAAVRLIHHDSGTLDYIDIIHVDLAHLMPVRVMPKHGGIKHNACWPVCSIMLNFSNTRHESVHKHDLLAQSIDHQNNT